MTDPVRTPSGGVFDRAAIEDYVTEHGKDPQNGVALQIDALVPAADIAEAIRVYHFQQILGFRRL